MDTDRIIGPDDAEAVKRIEAVSRVVLAATQSANATNFSGRTKTAYAEERKAVTALLRLLLGRKPTDSEIEAARGG